jgi:signal peptide peptidase SppA
MTTASAPMMPHDVSPLTARFAAVPALVAPGSEAQLNGCLAALAAVPQIDEMLRDGAAAEDGFWPAPDDWRAAYRPYVVRDGVLQIPIKGILLHDFSYAIGSFATGYVYIRRAFERGMDDPTVRGIALVCDSDGGEVAGNFDLVDRLYARRGEKPVRAFAHERAYSAAYSIASAADSIVMSRTGGVGSIGVVTAHLDVTKALEQAGLKVTLVYAGKHKVDQYPYRELSADAKARMQARVDALYEIFVGSVARNRGLSPQAVRATEALTFTAQEALSLNLADAVGVLDDAVAAFAADLSSDQGDEDMSQTTTQNSTQQLPVAANAAADQARAEGETAGRAAGKADGIKEGVVAERARAKAILGSEHAEGREGLAQHLAFSTDMPAEQAVATLQAAPKEQAAQPSSRLDALAAAGQLPQPAVGTEPSAAAPANDFEAGRQAVLARKAKAAA